MFKNSSTILFILILLMGSLITISSNSWLSAWMGLEINLLSFIPLMNNNNLMSTESSLKYFLIQALASSILLFSIILIYLKFNLNYLLMKKIKYIQIMLISTLLLKMGAAPFHFWFPAVMEGLSWMNSLILMTWQKIAPMTLISYFYEMKFLIIIIIISVTMGAIGGLNQTSLRKIMAYSSINHLGWMISSMMINNNLWMFYFFNYCLLSFNLIFMFNLYNIFHINQLFCMFFNSKLIKFMFFLNFLSLGGLPPFMGFLPKWIIIQYLTFNNQFFILLIMIMMTLITLFFYIRMCYSAFMLNFYEISWNFNLVNNKWLMNAYLIMSFISIFMLFIISLMYYIY